jgi:hypothetical protein
MELEVVLKKAWKIIWKHKILWLFGVLASCGTVSTRGGGNSGYVTSGSNAPSSSGSAFSFLSPTLSHRFSIFMQTIENIDPWVIVMMVLFMVFMGITLSILFLFLGTLGTVGVIKGTALADEAEADAKPLSFSAIFKAIKPYCWKVLLFNVALGFVAILAFFLLAVPVTLLTVCTCFLGLFLLIPLGWLIQVMVTFTTIAIVDEDHDILHAIGRAWEIIVHNLGYVIVMFLILGIGQIVIGLIIGLPLIVVPIPILLNLFATGFTTFSWGLVLSFMLFLGLLPFVIFLGGILKAYVLASWTLTYRYLANKADLEPTVLQTSDEDSSWEKEI